MNSILAKFLTFSFILMLGSNLAFGNAEPEEVLIKSSIVCGMCKNTIEKGLAYEKGIKSVRVDVEKNEIFIKYDPEKLSLEDVKMKINELGYVADDMKPSKEAYSKLHDCCKAGGVCED